ncbi:MAG: type I 3-dehydroquinate dehydratase [Phycisphaerales bacterium]|nr:type I 3-dehydroquinate dehydratase [Phycisphaerales bacterium]
MTFIAVSIAIESAAEVPSALQRAVRAAEDGAELVEWRIDEIANEPDGAALTTRLVAESPLPSIVTCRPIWEGGYYDGGDDERVSLFEAVGTADHPPRYLDVELAAYARSRNLRQKVNLVVAHPEQVRDLRTALVLSSHDFDGRPADLLRRLHAMQDEPACAVAKLAWRARSIRDNLEAFELLRHRGKPMIALCMGDFGVMSRLLGPKFGALLTFANDEEGRGTAPGQPTVRELSQVYRFRRIGPATRVYGVIGWPVRQSKGPLVHNAAFDAVGHDGAYVPMPIAPGWEPFKATVDALLEAHWLDFRGASVTIPHKENLLRFVRERDGAVHPDAEAIGAANTLVVREDGTLECLNTDAPAAVQTLIEDGGIGEGDLAEARIAVIGAGGAARAAVRGLSEVGATVTVLNRTSERAERLAAALNGLPTRRGRAAEVRTGNMQELSSTSFAVIVNCTPAGMAGGTAPDALPVPDDVRLEGTTTVFDTVYNPPGTPLLALARDRGARTVGGTGMFLRQAALQSTAWTGHAGALDAMRRAMEDALPTTSSRSEP